MHRTYNGTDWLLDYVPPADVPNGYYRAAKIVIDPISGYPRILASLRRGGYLGLYYYLWNGSAWAEELIEDGATYSRAPCQDLAIDANGVAHIIAYFIGTLPGDVYRETIAYQERSLAGTWSAIEFWDTPITILRCCGHA